LYDATYDLRGVRSVLVASRDMICHKIFRHCLDTSASRMGRQMDSLQSYAWRIQTTLFQNMFIGIKRLHAQTPDYRNYSARVFPLTCNCQSNLESKQDLQEQSHKTECDSSDCSVHPNWHAIVRYPLCHLCRICIRNGSSRGIRN